MVTVSFLKIEKEGVWRITIEKALGGAEQSKNSRKGKKVNPLLFFDPIRDNDWQSKVVGAD